MTSSNVSTDYINLRISDGTQMQAYLARPRSEGKYSGIMVFQEAFGVNAHIRDVTERFASKGFVAVSPELFHRTVPPGWEGSYGDFASVVPHMQAVNDTALGADIRATHEWLTSAPQVDKNATACVGYCMGGRVSFLANALVPVKAAISYYGGGIAPGPCGPGLLSHTSELHGPHCSHLECTLSRISQSTVNARTSSTRTKCGAVEDTTREQEVTNSPDRAS